MKQHKQKKQIPPPPDAKASGEEQAAYFEKYSWEELEQAGYLQSLNEEDKQFVKRVREEASKRVASRRASRSADC
jgi:hypothetical protein